MVNRKGIDLREVTKRAVRAEIRRLQSIARDYFYVNDEKNKVLGTHTVKEIYELIVKAYKLNKDKAYPLKKGLERHVENELIVRLGKKNVQKKRLDKGDVIFLVTFQNDDYGNIVRKLKRDNVVKQKKEKVKISIQLDKDMRDAVRDYYETIGTTMSAEIRDYFNRILEEGYSRNGGGNLVNC